MANSSSSSSKAKFVKFGCRCSMCKQGRACPSGQAKIKRITRGARRTWNLLAVQGRDEEISAVSFGYLG